jgi:hypothetical protein
MSKSQSIANLITIALGIFVSYHSYHSLKLGILITPGAGFLPFLCGIALIVLGIVWRLQNLPPKAPSPTIESDGTPKATACEAEPTSLPGSGWKMYLAFAVTVIYSILFERIGFFLATLVFMLGWQVVVERERWLKAVIITALCTVAMYSLFRLLLHVELPPNPWFS